MEKGTGKELYCPKCKKYPDKIVETYLEPIKEYREWDEEAKDYSLYDGNFEYVEFEQTCGDCETKLDFKPYKDL